MYSVAQSNFAPLPSPIKPPTIEELKAMQAKLEKLNKPLPKVYAAYYGEDWKTQGDWVGRYGRQYAIMCGAAAPLDHHYFFEESTFKVRPFIGPNHRKNDSLRRWVHWIKSDNPRVMYAPLNGYRRQAEWDDHAETYPLTHSGPDLWYLLELRASGVYNISMYFMNKDGHDGHNRLRDYQIEIYPAGRPWTKFDDWGKFSVLADAQARKGQPLAKSRMRDFWGGVHKTFSVPGNSFYFVRINKNYSFNTILSSVCIDRIQGTETSQDKRTLPVMHGVHYNAPIVPEALPNSTSRTTHTLWNTLEAKASMVGYCDVQRFYKIKALRATRHATSELSPNHTAHLVADYQKWHLNYWDAPQRQAWAKAMHKAWDRLAEANPKYVSDQSKFLSTGKHPWAEWPK